MQICQDETYCTWDRRMVYIGDKIGLYDGDICHRVCRYRRWVGDQGGFIEELRCCCLRLCVVGEIHVLFLAFTLLCIELLGLWQLEANPIFYLLG